MFKLLFLIVLIQPFAVMTAYQCHNEGQYVRLTKIYLLIIGTVIIIEYQIFINVILLTIVLYRRN